MPDVRADATSTGCGPCLTGSPNALEAAHERSGVYESGSGECLVAASASCTMNNRRRLPWPARATPQRCGIPERFPMDQRADGMAAARHALLSALQLRSARCREPAGTRSNCLRLCVVRGPRQRSSPAAQSVVCGPRPRRCLYRRRSACCRSSWRGDGAAKHRHRGVTLTRLTLPSSRRPPSGAFRTAAYPVQRRCCATGGADRSAARPSTHARVLPSPAGI